LLSLYRQATRFQADPAIVDRLGSFRGETSTRLLLGLAQDSDIEPEIRAAAIATLSKRDTEYVSDSLASLLQPQIPLNIREPAAAALQEMNCGETCVGAVLHYLERQYRGDLDLESLEPRSPSLQRELDQNRRNITNLLHAKLSKEPETFTILTNVYGLGTPAPSGFGIAESNLLPPSEACRLLKESHNFFVAAPNPIRLKVKGELKLQMSRIGCAQ
jgi:hypothetical protein